MHRFGRGEIRRDRLMFSRSEGGGDSESGIGVRFRTGLDKKEQVSAEGWGMMGGRKKS